MLMPLQTENHIKPVMRMTRGSPLQQMITSNFMLPTAAAIHFVFFFSESERPTGPSDFGNQLSHVVRRELAFPRA